MDGEGQIISGVYGRLGGIDGALLLVVRGGGDGVLLLLRLLLVVGHAVVILVLAEGDHNFGRFLNIFQRPGALKRSGYIVVGVLSFTVHLDGVQGIAVLGVDGELHVLSGVYGLAGRINGAALALHAGGDGVLGLSDIGLAVAVLVIAPGGPDRLVLIHRDRGHGVGGGVLDAVNGFVVVLSHPADEEDGDILLSVVLHSVVGGSSDVAQSMRACRHIVYHIWISLTVERAAVGVVGQGIGVFRLVGVRHTVVVLVQTEGDRNRVILRHIGEGVGGPLFGHTSGEGAAVIGEDLFTCFVRINGNGVHGVVSAGGDGEGGVVSVGYIRLIGADGAVGPGGGGDVVVIFGDIRLVVVVPVQAPHCVDRHIAVDGHGASTEGGQRIAIAALIDSFAVVCGGPADEQHLMAVLVGVGRLEIIGGVQIMVLVVVQAGLRLFGRALTAEISAVGVIGQGAVVLVRSAVFVRILRKGDGDGVVGPDITQGEGSAGIPGDLSLPVVAVGISFHCGIVDILLYNGDGVQGVVFLGLDGKFGVCPGNHIAGRGRDGAVASINRSGDAIGLILHVGFAVAVGVIAPYGVDGLILRRDIHRGGEDAVIIAVIQAVNVAVLSLRPAHKGHIFTANLITGGLELIGGVQPVTGLRRDLLFLSSGGRNTVEISAVGVIGHGALLLCNVGLAVTVGVVAPGGIQGGVGVDSVGAGHSGGGGIVGGQDRSGLVSCIRPADEGHCDAAHGAVCGAAGQGYLTAACDVGLGRRDIGHTALNCVAVVSEGKASLRGVISVTDGNRRGYIASRVIHDPALWGGFISGIRILVSIFVARNCRLSQLIGGSRWDTGNGRGLAGLELEGPIGVQRSL